MKIIDISNMTNDQFATLYRNYHNNFITVTCFAEHYKINEVTAYHIIKMGYHAHENNIIKMRLLSTIDDLMTVSCSNDNDKIRMTMDNTIAKISAIINTL